MAEVTMDMFELTPDERRIKELESQLAQLKSEDAQTTPVKGSNAGKNHKVGRVDPARRYVLRDTKMKCWGRVPKQQEDIAKLLSSRMEVGVEYTEQEVWDFLIDGSGDYDSLCRSAQDPTYLFRYYRGLKNDGKRAGFIARDFLQVK